MHGGASFARLVIVPSSDSLTYSICCRQVHRGVYQTALALYERFQPLVEEHLASSPFAKVSFTVCPSTPFTFVLRAFVVAACGDAVPQAKEGMT